MLASSKPSLLLLIVQILNAGLFLGLFPSLAFAAPQGEPPSAGDAPPSPQPADWISTQASLAFTQLFTGTTAGVVYLSVPTDPALDPSNTACNSQDNLTNAWHQQSCSCHVSNNTAGAGAQHDLFCDLVMTSPYTTEGTIPEIALTWWGAFNDSSQGIPMYIMNEPGQSSCTACTITSLHQ